MQSTPLCGRKIVAIVESPFVLPAVPIYRAARLMGNPLGGRPSYLLLSVVPILCYNHAKLTREIPPMYDKIT